MFRYLIASAVTVLAATTLWVLLEEDGAKGGTATQGVLVLTAPAFEGVDFSAHNEEAGVEVCNSTFVPLAESGELKGGTDGNAEGSFVASAILPHGATVTSLSVTGNDNDGTNDIHAYLMRKRITDGLSPAKSNFRTMAHAQTEDAENNILQVGTDTTIGSPEISNALYSYFVELVICPITEAYAVRIFYTTPN